MMDSYDVLSQMPKEKLVRFEEAIMKVAPSPMRFGLYGAGAGALLGAVRGGSIWKHALVAGGAGVAAAALMDGAAVMGAVVGCDVCGEMAFGMEPPGYMRTGAMGESKSGLTSGVTLPLVGGVLGGVIGFGKEGPGTLGSALLGAGVGVFIAAFMGSYGAVPTHRVGARPESMYNRAPYGST